MDILRWPPSIVGSPEIPRRVRVSPLRGEEWRSSDRKVNIGLRKCRRFWHLFGQKANNSHSTRVQNIQKKFIIIIILEASKVARYLYLI